MFTEQQQVLHTLSFPNRFATWGLPLTWCVVFVHNLAPLLTPGLTKLFVGLYCALQALHGTLRPLSLPQRAQERLFPNKNLKNWCVSLAVRFANTVCDIFCALCSLFFIKNVSVGPAPYFAPLFIVAFALHVIVEMRVSEILHRLHRRADAFEGREFQPEEVQHLVSVEAVVQPST